ncbi:MAG: DUF962 domain-containing protein [Chitinophagales bacterium]|nr:DUF962 domain-containing protein [Chitinophagales bacterium]
MKTIQNWLDEYAESHQNPTNKKVHFVCVPLIFFTVVGLLYSIPFPQILQTKFLEINVATIALILVTLYYARLSFSLAVGMFFYALVCLFICHYISVNYSKGVLALVSFILFAIAWVFQFWGHKIEGKKPSFLKDLQFLLIGPAWIMSFIYKRLGISY